MKHMKIGKKLFLLSLSLLLCLGIVAGASLLLMNQINGANNVISQEWLPAVVDAEEISSAMAEHRIFELDHILTDNGAKKMVYGNQIRGKRQEIINTMDSYNSAVSDPEAKKMMDDAKKIWDEYVTLSDQMLKMSSDNQVAEATELITGKSRTKFDDVSNQCLKVVRYSKEGASNASARGQSVFNFSLIIIACLLLISVAISIVLASYIIRLIVKPLHKISKAASEIEMGNLNVEIDYQSNDEVGQIAKAFTEMSNRLKTIIQDIQFLLGEMSNGNFAIQTNCEAQYVGEYNAIMIAMRKINRTLSATLSKISSASDQVANGSEQVSSGAQALSQGATEQASSIEELSASIMEISSQVKQNAANAKQANSSAELAGRELLNSNNQMKSMVGAMDEITTKSSEISKIIKVIEDIAFQTNILALNAAVEAARAGAAGKGFAVVADEVRNLASKSAEAAKSTTDLIEETIVAVQNGSKIAASTASSLDESAKATEKAVALIDEIAAASDQQSHSISQVNIGVEQIASVVQTNSATAEESAAASEELSGQAQLLKELIGQFQLHETDSEESHQLEAEIYPEEDDSVNTAMGEFTDFTDIQMPDIAPFSGEVNSDKY